MEGELEQLITTAVGIAVYSVDISMTFFHQEGKDHSRERIRMIHTVTQRSWWHCSNKVEDLIWKERVDMNLQVIQKREKPILSQRLHHNPC